MKKYLGILIIIALGLIITGCSAVKTVNKDEGEELIGGNMQIPNPFVGYDSIDEAIKAAGFDCQIPETIEGYEGRKLQVMGDKMIQAIYGAENDIYVRKATGNEDISGDYNVYENNDVVNINDIEVTLRGNGDVVYSAIWSAEGYTYSVFAREGVSLETAESIISQIR